MFWAKRRPALAREASRFWDKLYLTAFAFNNRKKSRKSRGSGIIGMGHLAQ
jgi:hypothetical protein